MSVRKILNKITACITCSDRSLPTEEEEDLNPARRSTMKTTALQMYSDITEVKRRKAVHQKPPKIVQLESEKIEKDHHTLKMLTYALKSNPITSNLDDIQHQAIIEVMSPETKSADQILVQEGNIGDKMWVMIDGEVEIYKANGTLNQG